MASVRSSAELWRGDLPPQAANTADEVIREIDRMDGYVRDLLAYARSDSASARVVDLSPLVDTVVAKSGPALRRNGIEVKRTDARTRPAGVLADPVLLEHALTSIVTNAIEAMPDGGKLEIALWNDDARQQMVIGIGDTGAGITPEQLARIASSYFTSKSQGLGLGLALARGVIERFGGTMTISSTGGRGTTVSIRLGIAASHA